MHRHIAHPPAPESHGGGVLDNISDTLLNAFAKLRKPDERFLAMREGVDKSAEGLHNSERIWGRIRSRSSGKSSSVHKPHCVVSEAKELVNWKTAKTSPLTIMTLPSPYKDSVSWNLASQIRSTISRIPCWNSQRFYVIR